MKSKLSALVAALLLPAAALAHPGYDPAGGGAFLAGLSHPPGGLDHMLAMLAVGLWAALSGGRALWALPAAFVLAMIGGGVLGASGVSPPAVEPMILASVMLTGVAVALALRPPLVGAVALVALFGLSHGHAHGAEGPGMAVMASYGAGFVLATGGLIGAGLGLGRWFGAGAGLLATRTLGGAAVLGGLVLAGS